jgi:hypothetical protein
VRAPVWEDGVVMRRAIIVLVVVAGLMWTGTAGAQSPAWRPCGHYGNLGARGICVGAGGRRIFTARPVEGDTHAWSWITGFRQLADRRTGVVAYALFLGDASGTVDYRVVLRTWDSGRHWWPVRARTRLYSVDSPGPYDRVWRPVAARPCRFIGSACYPAPVAQAIEEAMA